MDMKEKIASLKKICASSLIYVAIFSCFVNLLMLTIPLYMLQIFDRVLASHSYNTLIYLSLIAAGALIVLTLLDITRARVLTRVSKWLDNQLSPSALSKCPDEILQGEQYSTQSLSDISCIRKFLNSPAIFALFDSPWVQIYLAIFFTSTNTRVYHYSRRAYFISFCTVE